jgi:hypothetical protein
MKIEITQVNEIRIAEIISDDILISKVQDALELMAESAHLGSGKIILHEKNILPAFFDLKTGIAGEILQKFSTYSFHLAIVGDYSKYPGRSLNDFMLESNRHGCINFVKSIGEARERLLKK